MKKLLMSLVILLPALATWGGGVRTDVTAQCLNNPSFEGDNTAALSAVTNAADGLRGYSVTAPQGWTVANSANAISLIVTADCYTDNNFGKVTALADGRQAYYLRIGWGYGQDRASPYCLYFRPISVRSA